MHCGPLVGVRAGARCACIPMFRMRVSVLQRTALVLSNGRSVHQHRERVRACVSIRARVLSASYLLSVAMFANTKSQRSLATARRLRLKVLFASRAQLFCDRTPRHARTAEHL